MLLEEIRRLRAMGEDGRRAAVLALRSARLGRSEPEHLGHGATGAAAPTPDDPMKYLTHSFDAAVMDRGGGSIFATKARGTLSAEAAARLEAWALDTPRRHPDAPGVKPKDDLEDFVGPERRRVLAPHKRTVGR
jgi:hypothetical protein